MFSIKSGYCFVTGDKEFEKLIPALSAHQDYVRSFRREEFDPDKKDSDEVIAERKELEDKMSTTRKDWWTEFCSIVEKSRS